jgi:phage tail-like protein
MSESGKRADPFPAFRFTIVFDDLPPGGFSDCTGLQMETEVQEYPEGGLNTHTHKFPGRSKVSAVTLKRGIVNRVLWDWFHDQTNGIVKPRSCTILVHDQSGGEDLMEFQLQKAFPTKWIGPELSASQNNLAVETLELAHQGLDRRK